jgi:hypothetical protein
VIKDVVRGLGKATVDEHDPFRDEARLREVNQDGVAGVGFLANGNELDFDHCGLRSGGCKARQHKDIPGRGESRPRGYGPVRLRVNRLRDAQATGARARGVRIATTTPVCTFVPVNDGGRARKAASCGRRARGHVILIDDVRLQPVDVSHTLI